MSPGTHTTAFDKERQESKPSSSGQLSLPAEIEAELHDNAAYGANTDLTMEANRAYGSIKSDNAVDGNQEALYEDTNLIEEAKAIAAEENNIIIYESTEDSQYIDQYDYIWAWITSF